MEGRNKSPLTQVNGPAKMYNNIINNNINNNSYYCACFIYFIWNTTKY